jgi:predicted secreted hydrolase
MKYKNIIYLVLFLIIAVTLYLFLDTETISKDEFSISDSMSETDIIGFAKADSSREFVFPRDHGAHNDFKLEWWYFTGNLRTTNGRQFGYQFTIFRNALSNSKPEIKSDFATNQLYFAHLGLTDIKSNKHYSFEKFARGAAGLTKAEYNPLEISIEDWSLKGEYLNNNYTAPKMEIKAKEDNISLELILEPVKNIVQHGEKGLSKKSNIQGNASYYYSLTRIKTDGTISIDGNDYLASGYSWMDREWSTSALAKNQKGWDWFSIQMSDNSELMFFRLRDTNSKTDFAKGTYVFADGRSESIESNEVEFRAIKTEKVESGINYPQKWNIKIPKYSLDIIAETQILDQEMKLSVKYYEGSIKVSGTNQNKMIDGLGYVELTGYTK